MRRALSTKERLRIADGRCPKCGGVAHASYYSHKTECDDFRCDGYYTPDEFWEAKDWANDTKVLVWVEDPILKGKHAAMKPVREAEGLERVKI